MIDRRGAGGTTSLFPARFDNHLVDTLPTHAPGTSAYLTVDEVAGILRCGRDTIVRNIRSGKLPALDLGTAGERCYRVRLADLEVMAAKPADCPPAGAEKGRATRRRSAAYKPQIVKV